MLLRIIFMGTEPCCMKRSWNSCRENLQLAQRVIEIRRVRSSAPGFHFGDGRNLETLMYEELLSLFDGHLSGMHFDADNEACVAQQCIQQLPESQLRIVVTVTFVEHHLFCVMRPAFGIAVVIQ